MEKINERNKLRRNGANYSKVKNNYFKYFIICLVLKSLVSRCFFGTFLYPFRSV